MSVDPMPRPDESSNAVTAVTDGSAVKPFRREGLGYVYEPAGKGVRLSVDFIARHRDELTGEIMVATMLPGMARHLHQARFNLSSTTSRATLARHLLTKTPDGTLPWEDLLEAFCAAVLRAERRTSPIVRVGRLDFGPEPPDTVERLLPSGMATQLFAPGKTGKGWIAWGMAVAVETGWPFAGLTTQRGHVLYLDWEDNAKRANQRVQMVARGMGLPEVPELAVKSMNGPLRHSVNDLARDIDADGFTMLIIDSAQKAIGAGGEYQSYESGAAQMFEALRLLGDDLTILLIDHVNKTDARGGRERAQAYGSVMKTNWVRNVWEVRKDQDEGARISQLGLYHVDSNHSELYKPFGLLLDFQTPGEVHIRQDDMATSDKLSATLSVADRCARALRFGPLALKEIAERVEASQDTCRVTMGRDKGRFLEMPNRRYELRNQLKIVDPADDGRDDDDLPFG